MTDTKRLCSLETENSRLKKLLAERDLEIETMKEIAAKREVNAVTRTLQVKYAVERGLSCRRARRLARCTFEPRL